MTTLIRVAAALFLVGVPAQLGVRPAAAAPAAGSLQRPIFTVRLTNQDTGAVVMRLAQAPEQQEEFIPIDQLPPQEQLPAAPLLIAAYAFVLLVFFGYVVSVSRRLAVIQREVERLDSNLKRNGKR